MINAFMNAVRLLSLVIQILIFTRFILSWISMGRPTPLLNLVYSLTEPLVSPVRNLVNKSPLGGAGMVMDLSPIFLLFLVRMLEDFIYSFLGAI